MEHADRTRPEWQESRYGIALSFTTLVAAAALNSLGTELNQASLGSRNQNLQQAIAGYKLALHVCTKAEFPFEWAGTQNNLGIAYRDLPSGDLAANLQQAIAYYEAALSVYTEADFPMDWAGTQNNLGNTYLDTPTGERGANLQRAIKCYEAALRVRTLADYPLDHGHSHLWMGNAYAILGDTASAREHFLLAVQGYTAAGLPPEWEWRTHAERRLREL